MFSHFWPSFAYNGLRHLVNFLTDCHPHTGKGGCPMTHYLFNATLFPIASSEYLSMIDHVLYVGTFIVCVILVGLIFYRLYQREDLR